MKISLLHATRGTPNRALATARVWRERAALPNSIEHLFAVQSNDLPSIEGFTAAGASFVTTAPPPPWASSSVANWNAAAARSTGDLLAVIADDLLPPNGWDQHLRLLPADAQQPYACYVPDTVRQDGLMCHPVLSRRLYQKRGYVFHPSFFGVYCDNDFTLRTQLEAPIYRIPDLLWQHEHFSKKENALPDQNARIQNSEEAYRYGKTALETLWPFHAAFEQTLKAGGPLAPYLSTLATLARACEHVTEFGIHGGESTLAFLHGLSNKTAHLRSYHPERIPLIEQIAQRPLPTDWRYHWAEPTSLDPIEETDLLLLNTRPTSQTLTAELRQQASQVRRYLVIAHSHAYAQEDASGAEGFNLALLRFLSSCPHWKVATRETEGSGLTILQKS